MTELENKIYTVATERHDLNKLKAIFDDHYQAFCEKHEDLLQAIENCKESLKADEKELRELVLESSNQEVKATFGVSIRKITRLEYDELSAIDWVITNNHRSLLKLDKKGFEKVAKVLSLEFVDIREERQATIGRDLSKVLSD